MDGGIRTFKPTVKTNELVFVEPARPNVLRLCRNSRGGIIDEPKAPLRSAPVVVLALQSPVISGVDVAAHVVGHRLLAALVDRSDHLDDLLGLDLASRPVAAQGVGDLVKALLCLLPGWLILVLEVFNVGLKQIGKGPPAVCLPRS